MFFHANLAANNVAAPAGAFDQSVTLRGLVRELRDAMRARREAAAAAALAEAEGAERAEVLAARCA